MGWARENLGIELNPIKVIESAGRKIDNEIIEPIKDVGRKIDDEIIQPVKNTVEAIVKDPKALAGVALSIAFPGAGAALGAKLGLGTGIAAKVAGQALINATINGGDVKAAVIGAVLPVAGKEIAGTLGATLDASNITGTVNNIITRAATQSATAAILGKDPLTAFVMGGVSAGVGAITNDIPGFKDLPAPAQNAISSAIGTKLVKGDVGNAIADSLVDDAIQWAKGQVNKAPAATKAAQEKYRSAFGKEIPDAQLAKAIETGGFEFLVASTDSLADILSTLDDTQKAKAISKIESSALEFTEAVNYTPKKWLEELSLGELPPVHIVADREKGWKHTTDDNGYTVMWNEDKGLVQLYDENDKLLKSLTDQFKKDKDGKVIGRNLDYYLTVAQDSFWRSGLQTASLIADVLPAMAAKAVGNNDYFNKQMSEAKAVVDKVNREYPSRVASYKNVNDLGSAATYVLESVMEGVVTTAPTLLMGGAAGVAARASAKAAMDSAIKKELAEQATKGVFGAEAIAAAQSAATRAGLASAAKYTTPAILAGSASQNVPEVFRNVYDAKSGKVDLKDLAISTVVGSFNAALDAVLPSAIVDRLNLSKIPVDEVIGAWYKTAAKEGGSAFLKEGGTEVLQEMSSAGAESFLAENKDFFTSENLERFVNAGLKGGIGGSAISTGFALGKDAAQAGKSLDSNEIIQQGMDKTTPAEYLAASQMFRDSGFNASVADIAAVTGGGAELQSDELRSALDAYMDPRVVDEQEARQALIDLGYTDPDQKEIQAFVGQRDESAALKEIEAQYDPLATTPEEAQQMMRDLGYTNLTNEEAQSLAGKIKESEAQENIQAYVDPRMVTRGEAEQFFRSIGYNPTEEEIAQFVRQGSDVSQQDVESELGAYTDPRMVSSQEVIDAYAALGLNKPIQADIDKLVGQYEQELLAGKAEENLGTAQFNVLTAEQEATRQALDELEAQSKSQYDALTAEQKALADAMVKQGVDLTAAIDLASQQTQAQITGLGEQVDTRINELMQQGQTYQEATQQAIGELNTQNRQLQDLVGTQGRSATQADVDALSQMLGGQRAVDLTYDVTGDKQITQADIDFLSQVVSGVKTDYTPPVGSFLGPTGLYGELAAIEAKRQADLQAQLLREQEAAAAAAEAQRRGKISATLAQGQQGLRQISQQLPQAFQQAQEVSTPIYGQMGPYLELGSPLDVGFFQPSPEKQAATKQQQPTKIAAGGYIDDLLAGDMTADDLLNLLR